MRGTGETISESSKSARTRRRILGAAAEVLNHNGYSGTWLSDIAERAQIQAPALYYYFASREELIEEVGTPGHGAGADPRHRDAGPTAGGGRGQQAGPDLRGGRRAPRGGATTAPTTPRPPSGTGRSRRPTPRQLRPSSVAYGDVWRTLVDEARQTGELHPELDLTAAPDAVTRRAELGDGVVEPGATVVPETVISTAEAAAPGRAWMAPPGGGSGAGRSAGDGRFQSPQGQAGVRPSRRLRLALRPG